MKTLVCALFPLTFLHAQQVCQVASPTASFSIPFVSEAPELNADPNSALWKRAASACYVWSPSDFVPMESISFDIRITK